MSGCSELNVFEVLSPGHDKATSTVRVAVVFDRDYELGGGGNEGGGAVSIVVLGLGEGEFPRVLEGGKEGLDAVKGLVQRMVMV